MKCLASLDRYNPMQDQTKTKQELIDELSSLRQRIKELEHAEAQLKKEVEKLKKSEARFRSYFDLPMHGIAITSPDKGWIQVNERICSIMGYSQDEIVHMTWSKMTHPDDLDADLEQFNRILSGDIGQYNMDKRFIRKDGEVVWTNLTVGCVRKSDGRVDHIIAVLEDITERKRAEVELQKSEERYRALVENASDIVFRTDEKGYFTFINPAALRISGYEEGEIIGKHYKMFVRPDMFKEAIANFANQLINRTKNTYTEYPVLTKEGHEVWLGQNTQLIMKEDQVTGFQAVARDISERKRAEKELSESEKKYRAMLENIQDGYYEVDLLGNLTYVNPSLSRILGYSQAELIGMNNRQYMDKENAKKVFKAFNTVYKTETPTSHFDWELIRKDMKKAFVGCSVSLIKDSFGKPIGFRGIVRDITYKKRAEEALKHSEKRYRELSIIDDLTQLYNSRYFYHQLKMETDRANRYKEQPMALLLLDLDDFKAFNDAYGHIEGDQVLSRLGQVVKRCLRQTDSAYRYGGEEFTVILPTTSSKDAAVIAERIRTEFKKENFSPAPGKNVHVTVSIGLGQYKPQEDMKIFVHRIDQLMYQAKKNGKDGICSEI